MTKDKQNTEEREELLLGNCLQDSPSSSTSMGRPEELQVLQQSARWGVPISATGFSDLQVKLTEDLLSGLKLNLLDTDYNWLG